MKHTSWEVIALAPNVVNVIEHCVSKRNTLRFLCQYISVRPRNDFLVCVIQSAVSIMPGATTRLSRAAHGLPRQALMSLFGVCHALRWGIRRRRPN